MHGVRPRVNNVSATMTALFVFFFTRVLFLESKYNRVNNEVLEVVICLNKPLELFPE